MEHEEIIQDVRELIKFPNIGKALFHKIEELKGILSENLEKYCPLIDGSPQRKSNDTATGVGFELRRIGENLWIPLIPDKPGANGYEVISQPIIDYITNHQKKVGVIEMKPGLKLPEIPGQVFDLIFEKISSKYIWGIIQTHQEDLSEFIYPSRQLAKTGLPEVEESTDKEEIIKILLYYLLNNPDYCGHVIDEFFYHWKPLLDSELLTASAI